MTQYLAKAGTSPNACTLVMKESIWYSEPVT